MLIEFKKLNKTMRNKSLEYFRNIVLVHNEPQMQFWRRILKAQLVLLVLNDFVSIWILVYQTLHHPSHLPYIFRKSSKDVKESVRCTQIILYLVTLTVFPIENYLLHLAIKLRKRRYFRIYYRIYQSIGLAFPMLLYSREYFHTNTSLSWNAIGDLIVIGIIFILYCWFIWAISYKIKELDFPAISKFEEHIESLQQHAYEIPEITLKFFQSYIINPLKIKLDFRQPIGQGEYGLVYHGTYLQNHKLIEIVTKVAKNTNEQQNNLDVLIQEIKILIHVSNPENENIVKFFGVTSSLHFKDNYGIVSEFCELGNLTDYLKSKYKNVSALDNSDANKKVDVEEFNTFAFQICRGMEFLASKKVIHGDLSTRNVLLKQSLMTNSTCVKITDFGLARRLYNYQIYAKQSQHVLMPWRWMSIEAIEDLKFSEKSDVWSFGVTMWEIFSIISIPYSGCNWSTDFPELLRSGLRLKKPNHASLPMYEIMNSCWDIQDVLRPNFSQLVISLSEA